MHVGFPALSAIRGPRRWPHTEVGYQGPAATTAAFYRQHIYRIPRRDAIRRSNDA